ncbi:myosin-binding protein C, fast-type-like, partial [Pyxicephalus adspersus]|uniref:myosin-binding protein C, fast-type-like n=1 Tax=Pyxicephalus adspersus TaxID=30357 RepID=UPI003B5B4B6B
EFTDIEGRVHVQTEKDLSSFVIDGAKREDEGNYKILVTNPSGQDTANLYVKVVDIPDPPQNIRITGVGEDWADVVWDPPKYDGGQPILGYLIERKKKGSQRWMKMNFELYTDTAYQSTNMIEGVLYEVRVFAVNSIGISQEANTTNPFMPIGKSYFIFFIFFFFLKNFYLVKT